MAAQELTEGQQWLRCLYKSDKILHIVMKATSAQSDNS
jgi:hypothetical protein